MQQNIQKKNVFSSETNFVHILTPTWHSYIKNLFKKLFAHKCKVSNRINFSSTRIDIPKKFVLNLSHFELLKLIVNKQEKFMIFLMAMTGRTKSFGCEWNGFVRFLNYISLSRRPSVYGISLCIFTDWMRLRDQYELIGSDPLQCVFECVSWKQFVEFSTQLLSSCIILCLQSTRSAANPIIKVVWGQTVFSSHNNAFLTISNVSIPIPIT